MLCEVVPLLDHVAHLADDHAVEDGHEGRGQDEDEHEEVDLLRAPEDRVVEVAHAPVAHHARAHLKVDLLGKFCEECVVISLRS